ncbi:MAG TPA: NAD(P)-dependent oxidoreductase [Chitinophagaceae bacterium]|nr:NAD(P)-dependent oxidoreductase [Chitinophagaceae bacterium]
MKIAMIGGTGQLGYFTIHRLHAMGHQTLAIGIGQAPEQGYLPDATTVLLRNTDECGVHELADLISGFDVIIHAAGADGRNLFDAPAIHGFRAANVEPIRNLVAAMKISGAKKLIILGSYYTAMHRMFPHLNIIDKSPYIRSRFEQNQVAFEEAGPGISVGILELPYIFGAAPKRGTPWGFYIDLLKQSRAVVHVHAGGTACITMNQVGIAAAHACEKLEGHKNYPIGNINLKYKELFEIFSANLDLKRNIIAMPPSHFAEKARLQSEHLAMAGKEAAYDALGLLDMEDHDFFIDPAPAAQALGIPPEDIEKAITQTIDATLKYNGNGLNNSKELLRP